MLSLMLEPLPVLFLLAVAIWLVSLYKDDVSIADYSWSIMLLVAVLVYVARAGVESTVNLVLILMVAIWAIRLAIFLIKRGRNQPEDRRYNAIRKKHSPNFALKSFYLIFMFQTFLVWSISVSFVPGFLVDSSLQWTLLHSVGAVIWLLGMMIETIADNQLHRFNQLVIKDQQTLDTGLWRYSRHPNYFGEFCIWWGWCLFAIPAALAAASPILLIAPLVMTMLLVKISGVRLMERGIVERRPDYQSYRDCTSSFFPWPPLEKVSDKK
jgi:steroid 5-alpha reductase family enzyme